jgi:hypothetical protein
MPMSSRPGVPLSASARIPGGGRLQLFSPMKARNSGTEIGEENRPYLGKDVGRAGAGGHRAICPVLGDRPELAFSW